MKYEGHFTVGKDIGRVRVTNEDQAFALRNYAGDTLLIVCDGMGGQNKGDYASKVAMDHVVEAFQKKRKTPVLLSRSWLRKVLKEANSIIFSEAEKNEMYRDMGTTAVVVLIQNDKMIIANIGDSRAYAFDERGLRRLTEDQTYVDYLYRSGQIEEREKDTSPDRHVLMNALGIYPSASFDLSIRPYCGEMILLCSDGLYNNVSEPEIRAILSTDEQLEQKVRSLIAEANANGGSDNVAIALWEAERHD